MRCGEGGKRTDSPAASGVDRWAESAPGQVVIPRMWGCLQGVLLEAEWPLNALRPHPRRASKKGWGLLSLKIPSSNHHSNPPSPILYDVEGDGRLQTHLQEYAGMNMQRVSKWTDICSVKTRGLSQWIRMTLLQISHWINKISVRLFCRKTTTAYAPSTCQAQIQLYDENKSCF